MKRIIQWTVSLVCIVSLMVACSKEPKHYAAEASYLAEEMVASSAQAVHKSVMQADVAESLVGNKRLNNAETLGDSSGAVASLVRQARKLIKNASLHMEVDDAMGTSKAITQTANAGGGYIADTSRQKIGNNRFSISMTVRMPVEKFDQSAEDFQQLGTVLNYSSSAQDVTEDYVDTESRTRNLKKSEERLLDHLSRSAKLEDILKAEKEITRVRGQIEQLEGRLRYLDTRVSFSSIHITLQDKLGPEAIIPPKSYSIAHEFSSAIQSLVGFGQGLLTRGIWAGVWSLVWLPLALLGFWITRRVYKMSKTG